MEAPSIQPRAVPAPVLVLVLLAAGWGLEHVHPWPLLPALGPWRAGAAAALVALALGIGLAALRELHRHQTPSSPYTPAATVVSSGIFRLTRNPMYLGFVLVGLGVALGMGSVWELLATALLAVLLDLLVIRPEERYLAARFGEAYRAYAVRTGRWF